MKYFLILTLLFASGCSTYRVSAELATEEAARNLDAIGRIEAKGICMVRLGLLFRSSPAWQMAALQAASVICPNK